MDTAIRTASADDLRWANARYRELDFLPSGPEDRLLIAWLDDRRVGLGRVVPVDPGVGELGGMYTAPEARGQGLAEALVRRLQQTGEERTLFCIPFADLLGLYERCGFRRVGPDDPVPQAVAGKLAWCRSRYPRPVALLQWSAR